MRDNLSFLTSAQIERWQVEFRQRIKEYKSVMRGIVTVGKTIMTQLDSVDPCPICYCTLHPSTHARRTRRVLSASASSTATV